MKRTFLGLLGFLLALSALAWLWYPRIPDDGRIHLVLTVGDNNSTREQVATFNAAHPDLLLKIDAEDTDSVKVIVQSLAGVGPDLFACHNSAALDAYVRAGIALEVTDDLAALGIDPETDFWNGAEPTFRHVDGRIYGVPLNVAVDCLWFHRDLVEEAGIRLPEEAMTWDAFVEIGRRLVQRDETGRITRYAFGLDWNRWLLFVRQWGGHLFSADGTRCTLDQPEAVAGITFMHDLIYRYEISPSPVAESAMASQGGWGSNSLIPQFGSKRVVCALGGRWWLIVLRQYQDLDLGLALGPYAKVQTYLSYGKSIVVNRRNPHAREAVRFLRFLTTDTFHEIVHRHADGFGALRRWAFERETLDDPAHPTETWNRVWRDTMERAQPETPSPFINSLIAARIVSEQLDLVRNNLKTPAEAMASATAAINREIEKNLSRQADLRTLYLERTGREWEAAQ